MYHTLRQKIHYVFKLKMCTAVSLAHDKQDYCSLDRQVSTEYTTKCLRTWSHTKNKTVIDKTVDVCTCILQVLQRRSF